MRIIPTILLILVLCVPASSWAAFSAVNPRISPTSSNPPKKILLLPPQMFVAEMSAGGVIQKQDDWTQQANENLLAAIEAHGRESNRFETLRMPNLSSAESEIVESHIGLYERLASAIHAYGQGKDSGWEQKKKEWDYTLGQGLSFLREKTGADYALVFAGADIISTGGRKATFTVGLLLGIAIPLGQSFITAGMVDLQSGIIEWLTYDQSMSMDTREPEEVESMVRDFFKTYPYP